MSSRLPIEINPYRCIEQIRLIDCEITLSKLPRLKMLLSSDRNKVKVSFEFIRNDVHLPMLKGHISVMLSLKCQRCLTPVEYPVNKDLSLILVATDTESAQLQDSYETYLVEDESIFLPDLIEEELILALPLSIMHEQCKGVHPETDVFFDIENDKDDKMVKENPFAILKNLKDSK
jgi:uncharacterized protein